MFAFPVPKELPVCNNTELKSSDNEAASYLGFRLAITGQESFRTWSPPMSQTNKNEWVSEAVFCVPLALWPHVRARPSTQPSAFTQA